MEFAQLCRRWSGRTVLTGAALLLLGLPVLRADGPCVESHMDPTGIPHSHSFFAMPGASPLFGEPSPIGQSSPTAQPHAGGAGWPSAGYPHYEDPPHFYDPWFRPRAFGLGKEERCRHHRPFRPRGYGNLFNRPSTPFRMDYHRYVVLDPYSGYGPSYYRRLPDPRCLHFKPCDMLCDWCRRTGKSESKATADWPALHAP